MSSICDDNYLRVMVVYTGGTFGMSLNDKNGKIVNYELKKSNINHEYFYVES